MIQSENVISRRTQTKTFKLLKEQNVPSGQPEVESFQQEKVGNNQYPITQSVNNTQVLKYVKAAADTCANALVLR